MATKMSRRVIQGLRELRVLAISPHGDDADRVLDLIVDRYNQRAIDFMERHGLIYQAKGWAWFRLLQVRFIQLVCDDRLFAKVSVRKLLDGLERPSLETLMRELFRVCLTEIIEWGRANKTKQASHCPKRADLYWQEAFDALASDIDESDWGGDLTCPPEAWVNILGVDFRHAIRPT